MFSYLSPIVNGLQEYLYEVSAETCKFIHETKYDNSHTIEEIKLKLYTFPTYFFVSFLVTFVFNHFHVLTLKKHKTCKYDVSSKC